MALAQRTPCAGAVFEPLRAGSRRGGDPGTSSLLVEVPARGADRRGAARAPGGWRGDRRDPRRHRGGAATARAAARARGAPARRADACHGRIGLGHGTRPESRVERDRASGGHPARRSPALRHTPHARRAGARGARRRPHRRPTTGPRSPAARPPQRSARPRRRPHRSVGDGPDGGRYRPGADRGRRASPAAGARIRR